jgi:PAS domain S-box-containing protein
VITLWNRAAEQLYGVSRSEAIGRDPRALLGTLRTDVLAQVVQALETLGQWRGELIQHANSGESLYVETAMKVPSRRRTDR